MARSLRSNRDRSGAAPRSRLCRATSGTCSTSRRAGSPRRCAPQRMRWAEGHTHNVRKWFLTIMRSPHVTPLEKLEFLYDSTYYLQAGLFVVGSLSWLVSELIFQTHVPGCTAIRGWSLL